jgi:hypothetical protein
MPKTVEGLIDQVSRATRSQLAPLRASPPVRALNACLDPPGDAASRAEGIPASLAIPLHRNGIVAFIAAPERGRCRFDEAFRPPFGA